MSTAHDYTVVDEVLEPVARCFTPDVARQIASLRADPKLRARLDELASKANEGELTEKEREEYAAYVEGIDDETGQITPLFYYLADCCCPAVLTV